MPIKAFCKGMILLAAVVSGGAAVAQAEALRIGGTGAALGPMTQLARAFIGHHPDVAVEVLPSLGSGGGIKALVAGAIDLAVSARPPKAAERSAGVEASAYGRSALVFAVAPQVPVDNLSTDDLVRIYSGRQGTWPDGSRIRIVLRPEMETDTKLVKRYIPGMDAALAIARARPAVPVFVTDQETADAIERIPGALATSSLSLIRGEARRLKPLSLNGIAATRATIADGSYPMTKTFYFVLPSSPSPAATAFVAFARSPEGAAILERTGHLVIAGRETEGGDQ